MVGFLGGGLASTLEYGINGGILVLAGILAAISWLAYQRNRDRKLEFIAIAFSLVSIKGGLVVLEPFLISQGYGYEAEIIEHAAPGLTLVAMVMFFVALTRD